MAAWCLTCRWRGCNCCKQAQCRHGAQQAASIHKRRACKLHKDRSAHCSAAGYTSTCQASHQAVCCGTACCCFAAWPTLVCNAQQRKASTSIYKAQHADLATSWFAGDYNYGAVLSLSLLFYEAQRSGFLPANQRVAWRGNSALNDKTPAGQDLIGG
jgi:hypothetical protein